MGHRHWLTLTTDYDSIAKKSIPRCSIFDNARQALLQVEQLSKLKNAADIRLSEHYVILEL
jgi:hypothetical protein